jgi:hypothetical protein
VLALGPFSQYLSNLSLMQWHTVGHKNLYKQ